MPGAGGEPLRAFERRLKERGIGLRPVEDGDGDFLRALFASTRTAELAALAHDPALQNLFLDSQLRARNAHYARLYGDDDQRLLLVDGRSAGLLYLGHGEEELRLIDLALLPEHRGAGLGTAVLRALLALAGARGVPMRLHVARHNPALRLYERLGFEPEAEEGVYVRMVCRVR